MKDRLTLASAVGVALSVLLVVAYTGGSDDSTPTPASDSGLDLDGSSDHCPVGLRLTEG